MAKGKKKKKEPTFLDTLPNTEEEFLERCIAVSEKYSIGNGDSLNEFFKNQAARQRKKLEELRKK